MSQDLLKDGGGATGLNPEGSGGVAKEVGGMGSQSEGKKKPNLGRDSAESFGHV
jgi:hypothetical protein